MTFDDRRYTHLTARDMHNLVPLAYSYGPSPKGDNEVVSMAASYELTLCSGCDNVHVWLKNDEGEYFATGTISLEHIDKVCISLQNIKRQILNRNSGACQ